MLSRAFVQSIDHASNVLRFSIVSKNIGSEQINLGEV
jgi:hypothetical protein